MIDSGGVQRDLFDGGVGERSDLRVELGDYRVPVAGDDLGGLGAVAGHSSGAEG